MAKHISVTGVVQGVGFRPFVYGLATRLNLQGWVCNTSGGVEILVDGLSPNLEKFIQSLTLEKPALAKIDAVRVEEAARQSFSSFEIRDSKSVDGDFQPISADIAICADCERELFDPDNRRYLYPFINCTNCGPRFTIIKDIPYDRPKTTMADFPMCKGCLTEYNNPLNRRFHAQPVACPECGPFVELRETRSRSSNLDSLISSIECRIFAIFKARRLLREGFIVAIKGLGGFHLACDASNLSAVKELRRRKGRVGKPFALMAANIKVIESICTVSDEERELLTSAEKPIVLLERRTLTTSQTFRVIEEVAPNMDSLGMMLPYTPLHHLLLNQTDPVLACEPVPPVLVMTSGNFSEEPIATNNEEALHKLSSLADAFLLHNRDIHICCDDSVLRVDKHTVVYLRRSRGYTPYPIRLPAASKPILAVGGELKNTFCLTRDRYAFLSHYIGDMENAETTESFEQGIQHLLRLFRVQPEIIAHDLHPDYFTTQYAKRFSSQQIGVQHHHAHIASCMADNGLENRRLIGLSFDGTGYGSDGTIWGGEI
ncbi:MAG TPA: carbamoyltransferase HypF, partial [Anaerolineales bacterium]